MPITEFFFLFSLILKHHHSRLLQLRSGGKIYRLPSAAHNISLPFQSIRCIYCQSTTSYFLGFPSVFIFFLFFHQNPWKIRLTSICYKYQGYLGERIRVKRALRDYPSHWFLTFSSQTTLSKSTPPFNPQPNF